MHFKFEEYFNKIKKIEKMILFFKKTLFDLKI
jgi:hypothetical protein